jgi:hypothetical protein
VPSGRTLVTNRVCGTVRRRGLETGIAGYRRGPRRSVGVTPGLADTAPDDRAQHPRPPIVIGRRPPDRDRLGRVWRSTSERRTPWTTTACHPGRAGEPAR